MARGISLADAEKLLTGKATFKDLLDRLSGPADVVGTVLPATGVALAALRLCRDLAPGLDALLDRAAAKLRKAPRHDRHEILTAIHAIVVIAAFFDTLDEAKPAAWIFDLTRDDQLRLSRARQDATPRGLASGLVRELLDARIPTPSPYRSHQATISHLGVRYRQMSESITTFIAETAAWERLTEAERDDITDALWSAVPEMAARRYEQYLRELAARHVEFALWLSLSELGAAGGERQELGRSLEALHDLLLRTGGPQATPDGIRLTLARAHEAVLARPVVGTGDDGGENGPRIPTVDEAYIDPAFRVAVVGPDTRPADERWWLDAVKRRQDLGRFLAGHLTTSAATEFPLVVLGHPGAGKSLLTKVIAARVPAALFPPVRVELRRVTADAPPRAQIEEALLELTGEHFTWSETARAAAAVGAVPVVLFDGFDELLQSTGVSQSTYLEQIREFQRVEAEQRRPVVVIVTSRTAVAHQMRIPTGCPVMKLDPFDERQIVRWLTTWNAVNESYFAAHGLLPPDIKTIRKAGDLGEQPLLLLMLALYDADDNALHAASGPFGRVQLYEGLLRRFVRREVEKDPQAARLTGDDVASLVERRIAQLAVVAFAMFNRGHQTVRADELRRDVAALQGGPVALTSPLALDEADLVGGKFFFVHESRVSVGPDGAALRTYEFLHATFGEYLIARESLELTRAIAGTGPSDGRGYAVTSAAEHRLRALLSFTPLTARTPIVSHLVQLAVGLDRSERRRCADRAVKLFQRSLQQTTETGLDGYAPVTCDVPTRYAVYSFNLAVLCLAFHVREIGLTQLFGVSETEAADRWRHVAALWRACLGSQSWDTVGSLLWILVERDSLQPAALVLGPELPNAHPPLSPLLVPGRPREFADLAGLELLADPLIDVLLGLAAPFVEYSSLFSQATEPERTWPASPSGFPVARQAIRLLITDDLSPTECLDVFRECVQALDRRLPRHQSFPRVLVQALRSHLDRLPRRESAEILADLVRVGDLGFEINLKLFDCLAALLDSRDSTADDSDETDLILAPLVDELVGRVRGAGYVGYFLGHAILGTYDSVEKSDLGRLATADPRRFGQLLTMVIQKEDPSRIHAAWLLVLKQLPDEALLRVPDETFVALESIDSDEARALRVRRSEAARRYIR